MRRKTALLVTLVVTLCLPLQSLASVLLPCLHGGDDMQTGSVSHPCHSTAETAPEKPFAADECHKCQLCMMLSVSALLPLLHPGTTAVSGGSVYSANAADHFYSHTPGQLLRPPSIHTPG